MTSGRVSLATGEHHVAWIAHGLPNMPVKLVMADSSTGKTILERLFKTGGDGLNAGLATVEIV